MKHFWIAATAAAMLWNAGGGAGAQSIRTSTSATTPQPLLRSGQTIPAGASPKSYKNGADNGNTPNLGLSMIETQKLTLENRNATKKYGLDSQKLMNDNKAIHRQMQQANPCGLRTNGGVGGC